jgi:hypothetical protein
VQLLRRLHNPPRRRRKSNTPPPSQPAQLKPVDRAFVKNQAPSVHVVSPDFLLASRAAAKRLDEADFTPDFLSTPPPFCLPSSPGQPPRAKPLADMVVPVSQNGLQGECDDAIFGLYAPPSPLDVVRPRLGAADTRAQVPQTRLEAPTPRAAAAELRHWGGGDDGAKAVGGGVLLAPPSAPTRPRVLEGRVFFLSLQLNAVEMVRRFYF